MPDDSSRLEALWPGGPRAVPEIVPATRPTDLAGRTIAFLWNSMFRGEEIFAVLRAGLTARHPDIRFVGDDAFGSILGSDEHEVLDRLPERLRGHKVDAVIVGVGC